MVYRNLSLITIPCNCDCKKEVRLLIYFMLSFPIFHGASEKGHIGFITPIILNYVISGIGAGLF